MIIIVWERVLRLENYSFLNRSYKYKFFRNKWRGKESLVIIDDFLKFSMNKFGRERIEERLDKFSYYLLNLYEFYV